LRIPYTAHVTNEEVRRRTGQSPVTSTIVSRRLRLFGHIARAWLRAQDCSKWRSVMETAMLTAGRATWWWWYVTRNLTPNLAVFAFFVTVRMLSTQWLNRPIDWSWWHWASDFVYNTLADGDDNYNNFTDYCYRPYKYTINCKAQLLLRVSILTRDIDIANLSVRPSVL